MTTLSIDMYVTAGVGVVALLLGMLFTRLVPFLKRFCIPAPVSGGLLISLVFLVCHSVIGLDFTFDGTIKDICMMLFFTSVGFQSNLRVLKQGGRPLIVMIVMVGLLIVLQNLLSLGIAKGLQLDPLVGMASGSIPMSGGHGTSAGFAPVLENMGLTGAASLTMAAATFGLVAGSLIGGPLGELLIHRHKLAKESDSKDVFTELEAGVPSKEQASEENLYRLYTKGACQLVLAMAMGIGLSKLLALTGITFPTYFGSLLMAAILRNVFSYRENRQDRTPLLCLDQIIAIGNICLSLFLGMAMATLKLWELSGLMLPLVIILIAQVVLIWLFSVFAAFPALGKNYDSAVLISGLCGFGLGATPNAMANMSAVCFKYFYSVKPFIIVPIIGAMFADIINTGVISLFLSLIK